MGIDGRIGFFLHGMFDHETADLFRVVGESVLFFSSHERQTDECATCLNVLKFRVRRYLGVSIFFDLDLSMSSHWRGVVIVGIYRTQVGHLSFTGSISYKYL